MSSIVNDPTLAKAVILILGAMVLVLAVAVVILALKKSQYYYVEDEDEIVETDKKKTREKPAAVVKPHKEKAVKPVITKQKPVDPFTEADAKEKEVTLEDTFADVPFSKESEEADEEAVEELTTGMTPVVEEKPEPDFDIPGAVPDKAEKTDTSFMPEMNNVPPVMQTKATEKEPGQRLIGVRVTIRVGDQETRADVTSFPCLIGREADCCDVIISEPAVSRRHARLLLKDEDVFIEDVSEHNGTFLNEMKIPPLGKARVHEGDRITLGRANITIDSFIYR